VAVLARIFLWQEKEPVLPVNGPVFTWIKSESLRRCEMPMPYEEEQMTMFAQDTWSGKMSPEHSAVTAEKTSPPYSKKRSGSQSRKPPLFLCLKKDGLQQDASWEKNGALLGEFSMHSFGESPSAAVESHLSQILEDTPHPKYSLSEKACQGILNRASRRGKKLPEPLENALRNQCHVPSKSEEDVVGGAKDL
jgi:hypothetical protein